jgi:hypothetical protein
MLYMSVRVSACVIRAAMLNCQRTSHKRSSTSFYRYSRPPPLPPPFPSLSLPQVNPAFQADRVRWDRRVLWDGRVVKDLREFVGRLDQWEREDGRGRRVPWGTGGIEARSGLRQSSCDVLG